MIYEKLYIFLYIAMNTQEKQLCGAVVMNISSKTVTAKIHFNNIVTTDNILLKMKLQQTILVKSVCNRVFP